MPNHSAGPAAQDRLRSPKEVDREKSPEVDHCGRWRIVFCQSEDFGCRLSSASGSPVDGPGSGGTDPAGCEASVADSLLSVTAVCGGVLYSVGSGLIEERDMVGVLRGLPRFLLPLEPDVLGS